MIERRAVKKTSAPRLKRRNRETALSAGQIHKHISSSVTVNKVQYKKMMFCSRYY